MGVCTNGGFDQCGGADFTGEICCPGSFECRRSDDYYSQCRPVVDPNDPCAGRYEQCGGITNGASWETCRIPDYECTYHNDYWSGCEPIDPCSNARFGQC